MYLSKIKYKHPVFEFRSFQMTPPNLIKNNIKADILHERLEVTENNYDINNNKFNYSKVIVTKEEEKIRNMIKNDKILSKIYEDRSIIDCEHKSSKDTKEGTNIFQLQLRDIKTTDNYPEWNIIWHNVLKFAILYIFMLYGLGLIFTLKVSWKTTLFACICYLIGSFGVTAGSNRLWSHRSYKSNLPLRIFLMLSHTFMFENNIYHWCREHRTHHKFTDTKVDHHNTKRGVFYSHFGWLMLKKTTKVIDAGRTIDLSDILEDTVVQFQIKFYYPLVALLAFFLPTFIPWYFWSENLWYSFIVCLARFMWGLNINFLVNSFAHAFGNKSYDKWSTELKTASKGLIKKRINGRTGDGFHKNMQDPLREDDDLTNNFEEVDNIWGWGDQDTNKKRYCQL